MEPYVHKIFEDTIFSDFREDSTFVKFYSLNNTMGS